MSFGYACNRNKCNRTDPGKTGKAQGQIPQGWVELPAKLGMGMDLVRHLCDDCAKEFENWMDNSVSGSNPWANPTLIRNAGPLDHPTRDPR